MQNHGLDDVLAHAAAGITTVAPFSMITARREGLSHRAVMTIKGKKKTPPRMTMAIAVTEVFFPHVDDALQNNPHGGGFYSWMAAPVTILMIFSISAVLLALYRSSDSPIPLF
jgi:antibiotic biosynthesis monooxygenase (ABM) superfamily enzyme